jgi:ribosomal protein S18 acetylase RimI-like enzyme
MIVDLTDFNEIETLKSWFPDKESGYIWCGPGLRFPFTHETFVEDIHWQKMPSYSLRSEEGVFIGFGQFYEKANRCNLARLVVSPECRSKGLGQSFIGQLMRIGMSELNVKECSLFVLNNNEKALKCYKSLGFIEQDYPEDHEHYEGINYMVFKNA